MANSKYNIREICGDWALDIQWGKEIIVLVFNSRNNAELVKKIFEWEDMHPNQAVPYMPAPHPCKPLTLEQLRERWKGCDSCKAACWNCSHNLLCRASNDEKCHNCFDQSRWEYNNYRNYCPERGRPLTDGAWVQLAKRLEGLKDAKAD